QKSFETALWTALSRFEPARPVWVESESRKIGSLRVPDALLARMRDSRCFRLEAESPVRVQLLLEDYRHFVGSRKSLARNYRDALTATVVKVCDKSHAAFRDIARSLIG